MTNGTGMANEPRDNISETKGIDQNVIRIIMKIMTESRIRLRSLSWTHILPDRRRSRRWVAVLSASD